MSTLLIETPTHGRALVRRASAPRAAGLLVGFHGYAETAEIQMERLAAIPGADAWRMLSVQALNRFYRGRSEEVVASWMTRQDRDAAIADNIRYVDAAVSAGREEGAMNQADNDEPIVYAGFSQGVPMAYRAAARGRSSCAGIVAVGGEIPPELAADRSLRLPPVLLVRGTRDEWYTQARFDADVEILESRAPHVQPIVVDGAHEWGADTCAAAGAFLSALQR